MRPIRFTLALIAASPSPGRAQRQPSEIRYRAGWGDIAAVGGASTVALLPRLLRLPAGAPSCAPCDPARLSGIDRWVVGANSAAARTSSDLLLVGIGGVAAAVATFDRSSAQARGNLAVLANAASWTAASTQWLKVLVHRKRPVLYTDGARAAAPDANSRQSFPSGHTSAAFAVATSYLVIAAREHLPHRTRNATLLFGSAAGIGALRMAGGRHFPTDVLGGALLGSTIGWLVAVVHPKSF